MLTAVAFIFVLGVLIFIHELGHFLVAKKVGIRVEKFSLGFPPNIFTKDVGETTYCIGIIPLGGYVKMAGENPGEELSGEPDEFMSKSVGQRAAVIFAGPFMNYLLAILITIGIFFFAGHPETEPGPVVVGVVAEDSPGQKAGLQPGDEIIKVDNIPVTDFESLSSHIYSHVEEPVELSWIRGTDTITKSIVTEAVVDTAVDGSTRTVGKVGFAPDVKLVGKYNPLEAITTGFLQTHYWVYETGRFFVKLITRQVSIKMVGGPVFIAKASGMAARKGLASLLGLMALLSINLAVINVLPIPILDGGHLAFLLAEKLKGKPLSLKTRAIAQQVGLVILLFIIIMVTYNDILRVF